MSKQKNWDTQWVREPGAALESANVRNCLSYVVVIAVCLWLIIEALYLKRAYEEPGPLLPMFSNLWAFFPFVIGTS